MCAVVFNYTQRNNTWCLYMYLLKYLQFGCNFIAPYCYTVHSSIQMNNSIQPIRSGLLKETRNASRTNTHQKSNRRHYSKVDYHCYFIIKVFDQMDRKRINLQPRSSNCFSSSPSQVLVYSIVIGYIFRYQNYVFIYNYMFQQTAIEREVGILYSFRFCIVLRYRRFGDQK